MHSSLRTKIVAAVAFGVLGLVAWTAGSLTTGSPSAPALAQTSIGGVQSGQEVCATIEKEVRRVCESLNKGTKEHERFDFLAPMSIGRVAPLAVCACEDVKVTYCEKEGDCSPLSGRGFAGHKVFFGATVRGSHCESFCSSAVGGTGTVYYDQCVQICAQY